MTKIYNRQSEKLKRITLRQAGTNTEAIVWSKLRAKRFGTYKFKRQYSIDRFVVDFYCPKAKLAVEIDGDYHSDTDVRLYDRYRQRLLESLGTNVMRFTNEDIHRNLKGVLNKISIILGDHANR